MEDGDEALARMLQEEEELRAAQALNGQLQLQPQQQLLGQGGAGRGFQVAEFDARLRSIMETALRCEDPGLQERARAVMPLERLRAAADEAVALSGRLGPDVAASSLEDELARELLRWFKTEFFSWVDTLPCTRCGSPHTRPEGSAQPLADDLAGGADRVELHRCVSCSTAVRFPRYNDPGRLLQPGCRRGRCGEWANAFLLCCRAAGLAARYVTDWSDHVWTEYYSHSMRRWVHLDSCEGSYDRPLLYEAGWGKQVSYVVAAGVWGAVDVTPRYTARWRRDALTRRTLVPERWLARRLDELTTARRAGWAASRRLVWLGRDAEERVELLRRRLEVRPAGRLAAAPEQPLPGRQTGSLEWRQQRGETGASGNAGTSTSTPAASAPAARLPTLYRLARDGPDKLPPVFAAAGRLSGGACRAAGDNGPSEGVERLFDGRATTKWLDFGAAGPGGTSWAEYRLPLDHQAVVVFGYQLVSANDCPERDPAGWRLEGVTEDDFAAGRIDQWTTLDQRAGVRFPSRFCPLAFHLPQPSPPCRRLRLAIAATAEPRAANSVQLACWDLYGSADTGGADQSVSSVGGVLQRLREAAGVGAAAGQSAEVVDPAALTLLARLLNNVRQEPAEPKFRKVRCAKVQTLLENALLKKVLLSYVRFQPLILPTAQTPAAGVAPAGDDVFLVLAADGSGSDMRRIDDVLKALGKH